MEDYNRVLSEHLDTTQESSTDVNGYSNFNGYRSGMLKFVQKQHDARGTTLTRNDVKNDSRVTALWDLTKGRVARVFLI